MKVFVCLLGLIACANASAYLAAPAALSTGTSTSSRTQDAAGNYAFAYNEQHSTGGSSRQESGNGWGAQGSYSLNVGDGRQRIVKYVADGAGFRAAISTNEPGTAAAPAASTAIASPHAPPQPVQPLPVPVVAAPAPVAVAAPAPLAIATNGWNSAPIAIAPVVKAVAAVPAVSSYSTSINHVAPAPAPIAVAAPVLAAPSGWNSAPAVVAAPAAIPALPALAPAPIVQAPLALSGWN